MTTVSLGLRCKQVVSIHLRTGLTYPGAPPIQFTLLVRRSLTLELIDLRFTPFQ